jgi:hypothetical protein
MSERTIVLGKVDYFRSGRSINEVDIKVRLERKQSASPHLTVDLRPVGVYTEFAMTGAVWNERRTDAVCCGQNVEEFAALFPGNGPLQRLAEVWRRWHLNGMRPGCSHQAAERWADRPLDPSKPTSAHVPHPGGGSGWNMLVWVPRRDHPEGLLSEPCPSCGHKYGSGWLVDPLPDEVEREILALMAEIAASADAAGAAAGARRP